MDPAGLLWINKDQKSTSFSNSKGDVSNRKLIGRHVQKWTTEATAPRQKATFRKHTFLLGAQRRDNGQELVAKHQVIPFAERTSKPCHCQDHPCRCTVENIPNSRNYFPVGNSSDPFAQSQVPLTIEIYRLVDYFIHSWSKTTFRGVHPPCPGTDIAAVKDSVTAHSIVQSCLSNKVHMYSLLSAMAGRIKHVTAHQIEQSDRPEYYYSEAVQLLRENIQSWALDPHQAVVDIFFLSTVEVYRKNYEGARAHFRMIKYFVDRMGGFQNFNNYIREVCWSIDCFAAIATFSQPIFEIMLPDVLLSAEQQWDIRQHLSYSKQQPAGQAILDSPGLFDAVLMPVVQNVVLMAQKAQYCWTCEAASTTDTSWVANRCASLMVRLLETCPDMTGERGFIAKQNCYRLAIVFWLPHEAAEISGVPSGQSIKWLIPANSKILRTCIESADIIIEGGWAPNDEMLLWVLAMGVLISYQDETAAWFSSRFLSHANRVGICYYFQLSSLFTAYLGLDRIEQASGWMLTQILEGQSPDTRLFADTYLNGKRAATVHKRFNQNLFILEVYRNV